MTQTVKTGDKVSVEYTGKFESGDVFDSSSGREPLTFTIGEGQVIPGFDNAVKDMSIGETKTVTVPPDEGYGNRRDDLMISMPKTNAPPDLNLETGMVVQLTDNSGNPVPATITSIEEENVILDINHPLAGRTLIFDIELVSIES